MPKQKARPEGPRNPAMPIRLRRNKRTPTSPPAPPSPNQPRPATVPQHSAAVVSSVRAALSLVEAREPWVADEAGALLRLRSLLSELKHLQSSSSPDLRPPQRTDESFHAFRSWLSSNGVRTRDMPLRFARAHGTDESNNNVTVYATRRINEGERVLRIPSRALLTADLADTRPALRELRRSVPALQAMPSIALALTLLAEAADPRSRYKPYIDILPRTFDIPFAAFSARETLALKPSRASRSAVMALRAQVKNYAHIYLALRSLQLSDFPPTYCSYANFEWAVAVVMTRQNALPIRDPPPLALVPLWDMCNHEPGKNTTTVIARADGTDPEVESLAMKTFERDEPVTIFYGPRPNTQLLLYSGFVQEDNQYDVVDIEVLMEGHASVAPVKVRLLNKAGIKVDQGINGWSCTVSVDRADKPLEMALAVARVILMSKQEITDLLKSGQQLPMAARDDVFEDKARTLVIQALERKIDAYDRATHDEGMSNHAAGLIEALHKNEKNVISEALEIITIQSVAV